MNDDLSFLNVNKIALTGMKSHSHELTSSENSVSPEASVTEDDHVCIYITLFLTFLKHLPYFLLKNFYLFFWF